MSEDVVSPGRVEREQAPITPQKSKPEPVRIPLRLKITLPYLLLAIVLALGAGFVLTQVVFDTVEERFTNQLIESGKLATNWTAREEARLLESLRLLMHAEGIPEAMMARDAERLRRLAFPIVIDNQEEAVEFLDAEGYLLLTLRHRINGMVEEYDFYSDGDNFFNKFDFAQNVLLGRVDRLGDKYAGYAQTDWGNYFYVSGPIFDEEGQVVGAVMVGKRLDRMVRQIREETQLAHVTIYNFEGQPISSTHAASPVLDGELVTELLASKNTRSLLRRELTTSEIDYSEIVGVWEARGGVNMGAIGASLPKAFLVTASRITRWQVSLLVGACLLLVILMGINLANLITRPLVQLVHASQEVAQGNLQIQVSTSSNDEVAVLARSFNSMITSVYQSKMDLIDAYDSTLAGWAKALELRDEETEGHTRRVVDLTVALAYRWGMNEKEIINVRRGAWLHDIGKMAVPDRILRKPGPLDDEEWAIMRAHPAHAFQMIYPIEYLRPAIDIPYCHHEKWDGSGYPRGLSGEQIPIAARLFCIVDVWDALRSHRAYREPMPDAEVIDYIMDCSGSQFDPQVVALFLAMIAEENRSNIR
jgi:HD-GYP domain-containing protein (c-di-GMP phosphodiesterase class II)